MRVGHSAVRAHRGERRYKTDKKPTHPAVRNKTAVSITGNLIAAKILSQQFSCLIYQSVVLKAQ